MTDNGPDYGDEINVVRPGFNGGGNKIMEMSSFDRAFNLRIWNSLMVMQSIMILFLNGFPPSD